MSGFEERISVHRTIGNMKTLFVATCSGDEWHVKDEIFFNSFETAKAACVCFNHPQYPPDWKVSERMIYDTLEEYQNR